MLLKIDSSGISSAALFSSCSVSYRVGRVVRKMCFLFIQHFRISNNLFNSIFVADFAETVLS